MFGELTLQCLVISPPPCCSLEVKQEAGSGATQGWRSGQIAEVVEGCRSDNGTLWA